MAESQKTEQEVATTSTPDNGRNPFLKAARSVLLAAIGAAALGKEEIEAIVNRLVERGEIAEKDGRELINELVERRKKDVSRLGDRLEDSTGMLEQRVEAVLERMNVPTKKDVENLSRKISALSKKVDELTKKMES